MLPRLYFSALLWLRSSEAVGSCQVWGNLSQSWLRGVVWSGVISSLPVFLIQLKRGKDKSYLFLSPPCQQKLRLLLAWL